MLYMHDLIYCPQHSTRQVVLFFSFLQKSKLRHWEVKSLHMPSRLCGQACTCVGHLDVVFLI